MVDRQHFDLAVIGGGVNGAAIARDAAGRGLKVLLCEQGDLAGATSSASSKLIHGGLRYLEHYEFRLVREALQEREVLLAAAPHIIRPWSFVLPHDAHLRSAWMIRAGLFLYDHLARRKSLPGSRGLDLARDPAGKPLKPGFAAGFCYSDCWVDDARLVALLAQDAAERGAEILTRTPCVSARRADGMWTATLRTGETQRAVRARALVNAAGPWVGDVLKRAIGRNDAPPPRLVKGSHIVVPKLYDGAHAYILQNPDRRIVFVIPYEDRFSLIGTTDVPFSGDPGRVSISPEETSYLCDAVGAWFRRAPAPADVRWSYAGVRPLFDDMSDDPSKVTRDYVLTLDGASGEPALLNVYGGKITTFRRLAEHALEKLEAHLPAMKPAWTSRAALPGGDIGTATFQAFLAEVQRRHAFLPPALALRLARAYGSRIERVLGGAESIAGLGRELVQAGGAGLYEREAEYLAAHEWAQTAEDMLWRRSKLGLHAAPQAAAALDDWLERRGRAA
ncbi:MAG: glycerol-3-phosphate dehydrogenase [Rhodospirillales bacterium]